MNESFRAPKGTYDILPPESRDWLYLESFAQGIFEKAGYGYVDTPIFEHTEVFERGVGEQSEVVGKQMYTFDDMGGRSLTLRPEGTAPVIRAVLEHHLDRGALPVKLFYIGPFFRQERPQKGRFRQFVQLGVEAVGSDDPRIDAEVIELAWTLLSELGVAPTLLLNSIGHPGPDCRQGYLRVLVEWLENGRDRLGAGDRDRIATNPLRTFDSKDEKTVAALADAPVITGHLCRDCRSHFESVQGLLGDIGVKYELDPHLVRGLDYYTRTAFELTAGRLGSQNAVGGGGRYDGLAESLGGPHLPGIGFALGADRIIMASDRRWTLLEPPHIYVVALGDEASSEALRIATELRSASMRAEFDVMGRGMKGQMKEADRSGARWAVILGDDELRSGKLTVKDLRTGDQGSVPRPELTAYFLDAYTTEMSELLGPGGPGTTS